MNHFAYIEPFCFAWFQGRFLILFGEELVDFSDRGLSRRPYRGNLVGGWKHDVIGNFHANGTVFDFIDHKIQFDFSKLKNTGYNHSSETIIPAMKEFILKSKEG